MLTLPPVFLCHALCLHPPPANPQHCLAQLHEAEPLQHMRLSKLLADKLAAAADLHGPELSAAMGALDPTIQQQVQAVLAAAGGQQQQQPQT
jgi:hypothetical protein